MMPCIVELGGNPDFTSRNTGVLDTLANLMLVAIGEGSIDVPISFLESDFHSIAHFVRLALPRSQSNCRNLVASVESEGFPVRAIIVSFSPQNWLFMGLIVGSGWHPIQHQ